MYYISLTIFSIIILACSSAKDSGKPGKIESIGSDALEISPTILFHSKDSIEFKVEVKRLEEVEGEYLPDSEELRIEIWNENGMLAWKSSEGMNYMQVITNVKPEQVGGIHWYNFMWNGITNRGKRLLPAEYDIYFIIPAKPKPYITKMKFNPDNWND